MTTKQQILQIKWREQGLCVVCGKEAAPSKKTKDGYGAYCELHLLRRKMRRHAKKEAK